MAYATLEKFAVYGLPSGAFTEIPDEQIRQHLQSNSDQADVWLDSLGGYTTPLSSWGEDLTRSVCQMTAFTVLSSLRGYNPEGSDRIIKEAHDQAIRDIQYMAVLNAPHLVDGP